MKTHKPQSSQASSDAVRLAGRAASPSAGSLDASPRVVAQARTLDAAFGSAVRSPQSDAQAPLQARAGNAPNAGPAANSGGLPGQLKSGIETLSGVDMSDVQVHTNSGKPAAIDALAYAQGNQIHLGPGQEHHLPHEAWHVVQQAQDRVRPTMQMKTGVPVNDDASLEQEADRMGAQAVAWTAPSTEEPSAQRMLAPGGSAALQRRSLDESAGRITIVNPSEQQARDAHAVGAPVQRQIRIKNDDEGRALQEPRELSADAALDLLIRKHGVVISDRLKFKLTQYEKAHTEFLSVEELAETVKNAVATERDEFKLPASAPVDHVEPDEKEGERDELDEEEEPAEKEPIEFFHGTDLATAKTLTKSTTKIAAQGKGEFGGGFYMTHDLHQAAHIADYYCASERRSDEWAVVKFAIPVESVLGLLQGRHIVDEEEAPSYYEAVKKDGNTKESPHAWTLGPIKDRATPYLQHLFARGALDVLNEKTTVRSLVLQGTVGLDKATYVPEVKDYDPEEDETLDRLLNLEAREEEEEEEADGPDYEYLEGRVKRAKEARKSAQVY